MELKNIIGIMLFFTLTLTQFGCTSNEDKKTIYPCGLTKVYDGKSSYRKVMFNFCDSLLKLDTLHIDELQGDTYDHIDEYFLSDVKNVELILPEGYSLKKVYRNVHIYPVILQGNPGDSDRKMLILKEYLYRSHKDLFMKDGNKFHFSHVYAGDDILRKFRKIKKDELMNSVINSVQNKDELSEWLKFSERYNIGDFNDRNNRNFEVFWFDTYLTLEIEHAGQAFKKVLYAVN